VTDTPAPVPADDEEGPHLRIPWTEGPDESVPKESWLALSDDDLLLRIDRVTAQEDEDDSLLEVVASHRHFFVRQEAAKRVRDRRRLFAFEDDRHVGQILVRHLTRREDLTYLERLVARCRHVEVRRAAQVQLARVWRRVEEADAAAGRRESIEAPATIDDPLPVVLMALEDGTDGGAEAAPPPVPASDVVDSSAPVTEAGVDASLLGWAAHFVVEHAWTHLGTTATRELLRRTHADLVHGRPGLGLFSVSQEARVSVGAAPGARLSGTSVGDLATWMVAFRDAACEVAPDVSRETVRAATALMADALREAGFYSECDAAENGRA
jgi:hypothetical protein